MVNHGAGPTRSRYQMSGYPFISVVIYAVHVWIICTHIHVFFMLNPKCGDKNLNLRRLFDNVCSSSALNTRAKRV